MLSIIFFCSNNKKWANTSNVSDMFVNTPRTTASFSDKSPRNVSSPIELAHAWCE